MNAAFINVIVARIHLVHTAVHAT